MDDPIRPTTLAAALPAYGQAYLLTASATGGPHATAVQPRLVDGVLHIAGPGRHSRNNVAARPKVALLWPPRDAAGYALVVDGDARSDGDELLVAPTRAVLTRSAPAPHPVAAGGCVSDCIELDFTGRPQPVARSA